MTLTQRLIFALWAGMFVVIAVSTADRLRREIQLFESDMRRDHAVMGRGIAAAVGQLWQQDSQKRALQILAGVNQREQAIQIRWVSAVPELPTEGQSEFAAAMQRGEANSWKSPTTEAR